MKRILLAILVSLALGARILFCLEVVGLHAPLRGDEIDYDRLAVSLASGKGFVNEYGEPTAARPPLYPIVLAGAYRLFGEREEAGRILQIVFGAAIVLLSYILSKKLFPEPVAITATAFVAFSPSLIFISSYLLVENLYILLLLTFLMLFVDGIEQPVSYRRCFVGGIILGLSSLARPNAFPLTLFVIAAYFLFSRERCAGRFLKSIVILASFFAMASPWILRNEVRFGSVVLFTTHGGLAFYQGNNQVVNDVPNYYGGVAPLEALPGWDSIRKMKDEIARDREAWRLGTSFVRENPKLVPRMLVRKFLRFWRFEADVGLSGVKSGWWWDKGKFLGNLASSVDAFFVYAVVSIPLFVIGLVATFRRYRKLVFLYGIIIMHTVIALAFFGSLRSRIPVEPVIAIFAAFGAVHLLRRIRRARCAAT
jgi:4-amino-4-deoxy-L-arabinose transferase-like glycosyltransferase